MTGRLEGKVAIIVGAGSIGDRPSNGSATALLFAREGARIFCVDRILSAGQNTVDQIIAEGGEAFAYEADVLDKEKIAALPAACIAQFGRIDILHYNVGIEVFGELTEVSDESWDRVHDINLKGAMAAARAVVPHLIEQGSGGSIINISSLASKIWSPNQYLSYSTSKAAMNHMSRIIARQYAKHQIRCNVILPGMINTPHAEALYPDAEAAAAGMKARDAFCPMGHQGDPWDIAYAALYLASDESKYVSGLELIVDGALSLGVG